MTKAWQLLRSLLEARSVNDFKEDIFKYMTRRYGEHAADELRDRMTSLPFKEFKRHASTEYFDPKLDGLIDTMAKQAIAVHKAKQSAAPEAGPGKTVSASGRSYVDPASAADQDAKIAAMRQARAAAAGGDEAARTLMTPGHGGGHAVGSAGQNRPKPQPSVAAGIRPQNPSDDPNVGHVPKSGLVKAQREVDKETREKGVAAGEKLAKRLGVPTTAERTTVHPDTGDKSIQIWGPDRVFKHMDVDRGGATPGMSDAERKAQSHKRARFAQAGQIDPDRLDKIKRGILQRNAAPTKLGPDRPPSFDGERWKPHGRETRVPSFRPDPMTGNWVHGTRVANPKDTGAELIGLGGKWVTPSVYASNVAQRKAHGITAEPGSGPDADQDFGDEKTQSDAERTDPDAAPFHDED